MALFRGSRSPVPRSRSFTAGTSAVGIREGARPRPHDLYGEPLCEAPQLARFTSTLEGHNLGAGAVERAPPPLCRADGALRPAAGSLMREKPARGTFIRRAAASPLLLCAKSNWPGVPPRKPPRAPSQQRELHPIGRLGQLGRMRTHHHVQPRVLVVAATQRVFVLILKRTTRPRFSPKRRHRL